MRTFDVKLIDVFPQDFTYPEDPKPGRRSAEPVMGGYQMMVRGEPFRAKFRNSLSKPEALTARQADGRGLLHAGREPHFPQGPSHHGAGARAHGSR